MYFVWYNFAIFTNVVKTMEKSRYSGSLEIGPPDFEVPGSFESSWKLSKVYSASNRQREKTYIFCVKKKIFF